MHHIRQLFCFVLLAIMYLATGHTAQAEIRACYEDRPWNQYYLGTGSSVPTNAPGVLIEILNIAAADAGLTIRYQRKPWKRCMFLLRENKVDAVVGPVHLPERAKYAHFPYDRDGKPDASRALVDVRYHLYARQENEIGWDGKTISGYQGEIGVVHGYAVKSVAAKTLKLPLRLMPDTKTGLRHLALGRLGLFASSATYADAIITREGLEIRKLEPPFNQTTGYLAFSRAFMKKHEPITAIMWDGIRDTRQSREEALWLKYSPGPIN